MKIAPLTYLRRCIQIEWHYNESETRVHAVIIDRRGKCKCRQQCKGCHVILKYLGYCDYTFGDTKNWRRVQEWMARYRPTANKFRDQIIAAELSKS